MSYQMIHMEAAYRLLEQFDWVKNQADYMLGSIAPDSVHFYPQYNLYLKEASHLWSYGPRWGITLASDKWRDNILEFWNTHKNSENKDYIAGFCVHILTDWMNDRTIFTPFREQIKSVEEYDDVYAIYAKEAYGIDQWLYQNSRNSSNIMALVAKGTPYSIRGCIEEDDVIIQKEHILNAQYAGKESFDISSYQYCTEKATLDFLDQCVDIIGKLMKE